MTSWNTPLISADKEIVIRTIIPITADVTYPSGVAVRVVNGGGFSISSGKILTINGPFEAGPYQVFYGPGYYNVRGLKEARGRWWGSDNYPKEAVVSSTERRTFGVLVGHEVVAGGPLGDVRVHGENEVPGATDTTTIINTALALGGNVTIPPGVWLVTGVTADVPGTTIMLMPGAILKLKDGSNAPVISATAADVTVTGGEPLAQLLLDGVVVTLVLVLQPGGELARGDAGLAADLRLRHAGGVDLGDPLPDGEGAFLVHGDYVGLLFAHLLASFCWLLPLRGQVEAGCVDPAFFAFKGVQTPFRVCFYAAAPDRP